MNRQSQSQTIRFKDLYLSAYLKARGFPLHDADLDQRGRTVFHFLETSELAKALKEYYAGTALVSPLTFIESFKALRSLTYSLSDSKNNMNWVNHGKTGNKTRPSEER